MSNQEALDIVDLVVEELRTQGVIPEQQYGTMSEDLRHALADKVEEHSNQ